MFLYDRPAARPRRIGPSNLAILARSHGGLRSFGRVLPDASASRCWPSFALPGLPMVPLAFLPFQTRPTWAYPAHYRWPWLLWSSQCWASWPALRWGPPGCEPGRGWQPFHVLQGSPDDLGLLFTPAVLVFAPGDYGDPGPDCMPFGPSLISLFGLLVVTMLTSIHLV